MELGQSVKVGLEVLVTDLLVGLAALINEKYEMKDSTKRHDMHHHTTNIHKNFLVYWIKTIQGFFMKSSHINIQVFV